MKNLMKACVVALSIAALVTGCEPGDGEGDDAGATTATSGTDGTTGASATDGTTGTTGTTGTAAKYTHLEIEDDANNPTLVECDAGSLKSPGADIDAAELDRGGSIIAHLSGCQLIAGDSICDNTSPEAVNAEGKPNSNGKEATGEYVALNSGKLQCAWSGDNDAQTDDKITVYEVGKSAGAGTGEIEQYYVRMCANANGNCLKNDTAGAGQVTFLVTDFL